MKTAILIFSLLTAWVTRAQVSTNATNHLSEPHSLYLGGRTNLVPAAQAIQVASHLQVGMGEADAAKFLQRHGITSSIVGTNGATNVYSMSIGCSHGWTAFYPLAEGCSLGLEMRPSQLRPDGLWGGNGLLERAIIQSNCVNIVTITLTNRP